MIKINYYILIFVAVVLVGGVQAVEQTMAQDDLPIQVAITPQDSVASVGSLFFYTITVTNTSSVSVDDVTVAATIPNGASFSHSESKQNGWLTSQGQANKVDGQVFWFRSEAMRPQEVAVFELFVKVQDDSVGQSLVNKAFVTIGVEDLFEAHDGPVADVVAVTPTIDLSTPTLNREEIFQTRAAHGETVVAQQTDSAFVQRTSQASTAQAERSITSTPSALDSTAIVDVPTSEPTVASTEAASQNLFCCFSGLIVVGLLSFFVVFNR